MKSNISFYTHDADSHNHWKFKTLRRKYDWAGEGKFWALNNLIAKSPNCLLDITSTNKKKAVAAELEFTLTQFEEFLSYLQNDCELIEINEGVVSTARTQDDLKRVNKKRETDRDQKSLRGAVFSQETVSDSQTKQEVSIPKTQLSYPENEQIRLDKIRVEENKEITNSETNSLVSAGTIAPAKSKDEQLKILEKKKQDCLRRREQFREYIRAFKEEYPPDMLNAFYKYWAEFNKSKTKMKWEMQQTWELPLRLATWARRNNQQFNKPHQTNGNNQHYRQANGTANGSKPPTGADRLTERLKANLQNYAAGASGDPGNEV